MAAPTSTQYTMLLFFKRNPQLSPSEFRSYYETHHVPLVISVAAEAKGLLTYTRRYLNHPASAPEQNVPFTIFGSADAEVPYDIVNEVTFESREAAEEFEKIFYGLEGNRKRVIEDEEKLFVRGEMRGMIVETMAS